MEVHACQIDTAEKLQSYTLGEATAELHTLLKNLQVPAHFEKKVWDRVRCMYQIQPKYDVSLYEQRDYTFGCHLDRVRDAAAMETPFCDWPALIAMVGKIIARSRRGGALASARAMPLL